MILRLAENENHPEEVLSKLTEDQGRYLNQVTANERILVFCGATETADSLRYPFLTIANRQTNDGFERFRGMAKETTWLL